ncbi:MAG: DUF6070 family protein [Butyricicoccus sp.]
MKRRMAILSLCILGLLALEGCSRSTDSKNSQIPAEGSGVVSEMEDGTENGMSPDVAEIAEQALKIADQYKEQYIYAEKKKEEYFPYDIVLSQQSIDAIEDQFIEEGYPVVDSDETYPSYLANSESFYRFWESVTEQEDAEQTLISIASTGDLQFRQLAFHGGEKQYVAISVKWDETDDPYVDDTVQCDVLDWDLTEAGNFYLQIQPSDPHYDDYSMIRLEPVNKELYDLNAQYIIPIGYQGNNLFTCDWDSSDFGELCFNDLFEFFYRVKYDHYYTQNSGTISADVFESVMKPFFDISWDEFRERCSYDEENQWYPWQEIGADHLTYYPGLEPDVVEKQDNADGTVSLVVDVRCNDYKEDCLFTHEVTIRQSEDGSYQYVKNQITYQGAYELPVYYPRVPQTEK